MNEPRPIDDHQAELLSAYLDGELSGDALERAEALLASEPAAAAELESLRGLSAEMRQLPRVAPPAGFAASVVDRLDAAPATTLRREASTGWSRYRRVAWAGMAIAAALLLMVALPPEPDDAGRVATAPVHPPEADEWDRPAIPEGLRIEPVSPGPHDEPNAKPAFANVQRLDDRRREDLRVEIDCLSEEAARERFDELLTKHGLKSIYRVREQEASRPAGHRTAWVECEPAGLRALLEECEALSSYQLRRAPADILETPLPGLAHVLLRLHYSTAEP